MNLFNRIARAVKPKPRIRDQAPFQRAMREGLLMGIPDAARRTVVVVERLNDSVLPPHFRKIVVCLN